MSVGKAPPPEMAPASVGVEVKVGVGGVGEIVGVLLGVEIIMGVGVSTGGEVGVASRAKASLSEQAVKAKAKKRL